MTRCSPQTVSSPGLRSIADVGELEDFLDEDLRQLIDPVVNEHVAGARDGSSAMRDIVDRRTYGGRALHREHPQNCGRRSELSDQTLHENCPNRRRLQAVCETSDGFRFHTGPTAHVSAICCLLYTSPSPRD